MQRQISQLTCNDCGSLKSLHIIANSKTIQEVLTYISDINKGIEDEKNISSQDESIFINLQNTDYAASF